MARRARGLLFALALLAVLQPVLTTIIPDISGWSPEHGHLTLGSVVPPHAHPYDPASVPVLRCGVVTTSPSVPEPTAEDAGDATRSSGAARVAFRSSELGLAAYLPSASPPLLACLGPASEAPAYVAVVVAAEPAAPLPPPPKA